MRKLEISALELNDIVVHDIPKHKKQDFSKEPNYSKLKCELSELLKSFFKDKIVLALTGDTSFKICFDSSTDSPVGSFALNLIKEEEAFIDLSKKITHYLFSIQKGNNASGIILIIRGTLSEKKVFIILKLEKDEGAQLNLNPETESYNIIEVQDLMLTKKTKVFKIALLFDRESFSQDYDGHIMDFQTNIKQKRELSTYFISDFLGCKPHEDPKITTQRFYNLTSEFINFCIDDPIKQAKYHQDLNSYLQKNTQTLNPKEFADDYLADSVEKDEYKTFLSSKQFSFTAFPKDTVLIDSKIQKFVIAFQNGISIIGNKGTFDDKVKITDEGNGIHKAEIVSKIKKIQ